MPLFALEPQTRIYIAGHSGMVGSSVLRELNDRGYANLITASSSELDLRNRDAVFSFFAKSAPEVVVLAAAKVGGILANSTYPADFLSDNLQIQVNVMDAAREIAVPRLLFLGSSCIYPRLASQPISEEQLLSGPLEATNDAYAIAKIAGIKQVQAIRKQDGLRWISAMPSNLYGPGDNYSELGSHVLPGLIRRYATAKSRGDVSVTNWGTGSPLREFLYVDDLAKACLHLLENYDSDGHINVGTGSDVSISELADLIANKVGYQGETRWDNSKPDGTPRKLLDVSKITELGWKPETTLEEGIEKALADFRSRYGDEL